MEQKMARPASLSITCVIPQVRSDLMPDDEPDIPLSHFFVELPSK